ncbi:MAG: D-aminoacyl-tRNA deacylase [Nitrosopumilaceae archaeon]|nr:D-aminoacyl-tRNA deacylase [Nitrosopumilaceae archaeon]
MDLLVAYGSDPAGRNMAEHLARDMSRQNGVYRGDAYELAVLETPAISADWLESEFGYDGYVFLSKHAAESGRLALTCHSTGNFGEEAAFGGSPRQVAVPYPSLQKEYMRALWERRESFGSFDITLEATHHGPTALSVRTIFVEVGTTPEQWNDARLCGSVADALAESMGRPARAHPVAVCFGGTHYPKKFTREVIHGEYALGSIVPAHALEWVDDSMLSHILERNAGASAALLDWDLMGPHRRRILEMLEGTDLEVVRL